MSAHSFRHLRGLVLALFIAVLPAAATVPEPWTPRPGDYMWTPALSPSGPVVVVVSLPLQQLHVYRNGVRIGASTISSGRPGHSTPTGAFTILQKRVEHYSNLYDNAPMPYMQRLTWGGIALHAGRLPGHPASHGCIRLPDAFARLLFGVTRHGDVVVVTGRAFVPGVASGVDPLVALGRAPVDSPAPTAVGDTWMPERSLEGPVSVVLSTADSRLVISRDGERIGDFAVRVEPGLSLGTRAYVLLDGADADADAQPLLPGGLVRRWMTVEVEPAALQAEPVRAAMKRGALGVSVDVLRRVDSVLRTGATVIVTDAALGDRLHREPLELEGVGPRK